jgi:hypothetical protein
MALLDKSFDNSLPTSGQVWRHIPVIPAIRGQRQEDGEFQPSQGYMETPISKTKQTKTGLSIECLPGMFKFLGWIPSTEKKKKKVNKLKVKK